jgi:hypothetical protein
MLPWHAQMCSCTCGAASLRADMQPKPAAGDDGGEGGEQQAHSDADVLAKLYDILKSVDMQVRAWRASSQRSGRRLTAAAALVPLGSSSAFQPPAAVAAVTAWVDVCLRCWLAFCECCEHLRQTSTQAVIAVTAAVRAWPW